MSPLALRFRPITGLVAAATVLNVVLVGSGCGSSSAPRGDYYQELDVAVERQSQRTQDALAHVSESDPAAFLEPFNNGMQSFVTDLESLEPPSSLASAHQGFVSAASELLAYSQDIESDERKGNVTDVELSRRFEASEQLITKFDAACEELSREVAEVIQLPCDLLLSQ